MRKGNFAKYFYALENVEPAKIAEIGQTLAGISEAGGRIFTAGNGGSHCIAQHLASDLMKPVGDLLIIPYGIFNLTDNVALMTALSNDIGYSHIFELQAEMLNLSKEDAIIVFSVSGTSENLARLMAFALNTKCAVVAITGKPPRPGRVHPAWIADESNHYLGVETGLDRDSPDHYYVCESVFSCIAHAIAKEFHTLRGNYDAET